MLLGREMEEKGMVEAACASLIQLKAVTHQEVGREPTSDLLRSSVSTNPLQSSNFLGVTNRRFNLFDRVLDPVIGTTQIAVKTLQLVISLVVAGKPQTSNGIFDTVVAHDAVADLRPSQW